MVRVVRETNQYKALCEETLRRSGQQVPMVLTPDSSQWKKKCEELQQENKRILK